MRATQELVLVSATGMALAVTASAAEPIVQSQALQRIEQARDLLAQLEPYYDQSRPLPPAPR